MYVDHVLIWKGGQNAIIEAESCEHAIEIAKELRGFQTVVAVYPRHFDNDAGHEIEEDLLECLRQDSVYVVRWLDGVETFAEVSDAIKALEVATRLRPGAPVEAVFPRCLAEEFEEQEEVIDEEQEESQLD